MTASSSSAPPNRVLAPIDLGQGVVIEDPVILAPLSGVTDLPFRQLARDLGAGLVVSEMIASWAMIRENENTMRMARSAGNLCARAQRGVVERIPSRA